MNHPAVSAQQTAAAPRCIAGCAADHTGQPANMRECTATDQIGAVRGTVAGMAPGYVAVNRWQDPTGTGGEVVVFAPEHDALSGSNAPELDAADSEPSTYTPKQARQLAALLVRGADLVDAQLAGAR